MIPTYGPDDVSDSRWVNFWRVCPYWKTYQCPCMWRIWAAKKVGGIRNVAWRKPAYPLASALIQDFRQNIHTPGSTHLIVRNSHQFRLLTLGSTYVRRTTSTSTSYVPSTPLNPLFIPAYPSLLISNTLSTLSALLSSPHTLLLCYPLFTLPSILFLTLSYRSHSPRYTPHTPGNTYATMPACATPRLSTPLPSLNEPSLLLHISP